MLASNMECWNNGILECWFLKGYHPVLILLSIQILPLAQYCIIPEPIIPLFQHSTIPIGPARFCFAMAGGAKPLTCLDKGKVRDVY